MQVRAEDGRPVTGLDISPFINNLPRGRDTCQFSTEDASGSTSQAANIMEALEAEATSLLVDEVSFSMIHTHCTGVNRHQVNGK